nr:hypothetical protein [uncultured Mucilaginibacter sp.]
MVLAGLGMVVGKVTGGKQADMMEPVRACILLLFAMAATLVLIYFFSGIQLISLTLTFVTGVLSIALATPIQTLKIRTAVEAEMLGAAATQVAFNIGNALGAFFGGLPIAAGLGYNRHQW